MASVPAPAPFASSKETTNYARLCRLLVDVGTQALRDTFDTIHPPATLPKVLSLAHPTLLFLKKKVLNPTQWGKLYPTHPSSVSSASFDITLLMVLLRNICSLTPPASTGSWDELPLPGDNSREANIVRIKYYRNQVYAHASQASVDDATFNMLWQDISNALLGLGSGATYSSAISCLKTECMDPVVEEHYQKLLKEWKIDDENTKEKLENLEEMLKQWKSDEDSAKDMIGEVQDSLQQLKSQGASSITKLGETEDMLKKLETDVASSKDTLKETHDSLQQLKSQGASLITKLGETEDILKKLEPDVANSKDTLKETHDILKKLEPDVATSKDILKETHEMLKQLKSQGDSSNTKHGETEGTVKNRIIHEMD